MDLLRFSYAPHRPWHYIAALPAAGLVVGLLGPFGSYTGMDLLQRCLHFGLCFTVIGTLVLEGSYLMARQFFAGLLPLWAALAFDVALSVPEAGIIYGSLRILGPGALPYVHFGDLVWQNLLMTLLIRAIVLTAALVRNRQLVQAAPEAVAARPDFPLAEKLPFALKGAGVLALSAEDHYLRVYTTRGEALILMALSEATEVLGGGFQIHRSHWIAGRSLKDYDAGRVHLTTGLSLPLSRHRRKAFEAWLAETGITPA